MELDVPEPCYGRIVQEIAAMRGEVDASRLSGERIHLIARTPMATSVDFSVRLAAMTGGSGTMTTRLCGYQDCDMQPQLACPRRGVSPLDTAKYILAARSAMDGGVFTL